MAVSWRAVGGVALGIGAMAASFWAGRATLSTPDEVAQQPVDQVGVEVRSGELGRVLTLSTKVTRATQPVAANRLVGTLTSIADSREFAEGATVYTVGATPVRVIQGAGAQWRAMSAGTSGPDVLVVQEALARLGVLDSPKDVWDATTVAQVKAWQQAQGQPATGEFTLGELIAVPQLPAQLLVDQENGWPGAELGGGEVLLRRAAGEPTFVMELTRSQGAQVAAGTAVKVRHGAHSWAGVLGEASGRDDGVAMPVTAPDGGPPCAMECATLPLNESSLLTEVVIAPPEQGPIVPVSALSYQPDGRITVEVLVDGGTQRREVNVRAVADGQAVVDGVSPGERVRAVV